MQKAIQNISDVVCSPVENLPIHTLVPVVHEQVSNLMSNSTDTCTGTGTGIETTAVPQNETYNSILLKKVQSYNLL